MLTVPEVVDTENQVTSILSFLLDSSSIAMLIDRSGHKILSKFQAQDQVVILYSRQEPSTLQPKIYKIKFQESFSKNFMRQSSSSKQNENQTIQALSK